MLANLGIKPTETQRKLDRYYKLEDAFAKLNSTTPGSLQIKMENDYAKVGDSKLMGLYNIAVQDLTMEARKELFTIILNAIAVRDAKKIIEIGEAIEFLNELKGKTYKQDTYRMKILHWKRMLNTRESKWTIQKLASEIGWKEDFRHLRRLANELEFPLRTNKG